MRERIKEIAKANKLKVKDLLALTPNYDPFYVGSPADYKRAQWAYDIYKWVVSKWDDRKRTLADMGIYVGSRPHARAIHYLFFTGHPNPIKWNGERYLGTDRDWVGLQDALKKAKLLGLIAFGEIEDHKHPNVTRNLLRSEDSEISEPPDDGLYEKSLTFDNLSFNFDGLYSFDMELMLYNLYLKDIQKRIPVHVEIWTEKQRELVDVVAQEYWVNVQNAVGQQTYENVYSLLERAKYESDGRPLRILYLSDFDPRGEMTMPVGVSRIAEWMLASLHEFEGLDVKLKKLILTSEQIEEYDLPPAPVKTTESMMERWKENVGESICEIDSIETLFATEMVEILRDELSRYIPEEYVRYIKSFNERVDVEIASYNGTLKNKLRALKNSLNDTLKAKTEHLLGDFEKEVEVDMSLEYEDFLTLLDEFEEPNWEVDDGDGDWLFDSERVYGEQLESYKKVRGW